MHEHMNVELNTFFNIFFLQKQSERSLIVIMPVHV
jgi:hypothetical protein